MNWFTYTLLAAFSAALTTLFAKLGMKEVNSNLATAIRTTIALIFIWGIVFFKGAHKQALSIPQSSLLPLILCGVASGFSMLFYYKALQLGNASQVAPLDKLSLLITIILAIFILKEKVSLSIIFGAVLMSLGAILIGFGK
jgi:bacterial/archaeal transporter family protein